MKVLKRNNITVNYDSEKVLHAVLMAIKETKWPLAIGQSQLDLKLAKHQQAELVAAKVTEEVLALGIDVISTEQLQDIVEKVLEDINPEAGKRYILYRNHREKTRSKRRSYKILSDDFISKFKKLDSPMDQLGSFVYYRTYSRWLPEESRREFWWETIRRAVEYNISLDPMLSKEAAIKEAEELFENIFNLKQFMSGRTFWVGNTDVANKYPIANYNCAFNAIESLKQLKQVFYLLMVGSGVGISVQKKYVSKVEPIRSNYELINAHYIPLPAEERVDHTTMHFIDNTQVKLVVGDSKEGWATAIDLFFDIISSNMYKKVKTIIIDYCHVRPKGEELKTFGGTASGPESLLKMFDKIDKVIKSASVRQNTTHFKLRPIDIVDIVNIIGENVVSGGVRRTSEIILCDDDDDEVIQAKSNLYTTVDGKWVINQNLLHRQMSNNSIIYSKKPSRERLHYIMECMRKSGEPGWVNEEAAKKRNPRFKGVNPCGEILLDSKGLCNLQTVNLAAFIEMLYQSLPTQEQMLQLEDDFLFGATGALNLTKLFKAIKLAVRSSYRMTMAELELPDWDVVQKEQRLLGISMTGIQDAFNALNLDWIQKRSLLTELHDYARAVANEYAEEAGLNAPDLITTIKPEGTLSQLAGVSSGIHFSHSPFFIRRVRTSATDPITKVAEELGWPVYPEVGQDAETCTTKYVEFPAKAPNGRTKYDVSAIEQLEEYKLFMETYVDHNASITVHVRPHEWEEVEEWIWNNWDSCVALSFLALEDNYYEALPYEAITEEEYNKRVSEMAPFFPSLLAKYVTEKDSDLDASDCSSGLCPIR